MANSNEIYIKENTRTSHKRWESMVVYALHYALRDVKIESQYKVGSYLLDAYLPDLNLAIEIDENHHRYTKQADEDRELYIKQTLKCEFRRISIEDNIYERVDEIVEYVKSKGLEPWVHQIPVRTSNNYNYDGTYTAKNLEELKQAGTFDFVIALREEVEALGFMTSECDINGHIPAGNGLMGFMIDLDGMRMSVSVSKTKKPKLLVTDFVQGALDRFKLKLSEPCKNGEYYKIIGFEGQKQRAEFISYLMNLNQSRY